MLTWMPLARSSFARVRARASIAALPMLYGAPLARVVRRGDRRDHHDVAAVRGRAQVRQRQHGPGDAVRTRGRRPRASSPPDRCRPPSCPARRCRRCTPGCRARRSRRPPRRPSWRTRPGRRPMPGTRLRRPPAARIASTVLGRGVGVAAVVDRDRRTLRREQLADPAPMPRPPPVTSAIATIELTHVMLLFELPL